MKVGDKVKVIDESDPCYGKIGIIVSSEVWTMFPNMLIAVHSVKFEKTEEIRKNLGKLKPPFKVYAYVTKGKPYLSWEEGDYDCDDHGCHFADYTTFNTKYEWIDQTNGEEEILNGKVCYEFVCDRVLKLDQEPDYETSYQKIAKGSCLSFNDYYMYATWARNAIVYALHISELKVYDKPKELGEFKRWNIKRFYSDMTHWFPLTKAPQSWQFVEELK